MQGAVCSKVDQLAATLTTMPPFRFLEGERAHLVSRPVLTPVKKAAFLVGLRKPNKRACFFALTLGRSQNLTDDDLELVLQSTTSFSASWLEIITQQRLTGNQRRQMEVQFFELTSELVGNPSTSHIAHEVASKAFYLLTKHQTFTLSDVERLLSESWDLGILLGSSMGEEINLTILEGLANNPKSSTEVRRFVLEQTKTLPELSEQLRVMPGLDRSYLTNTPSTTSESSKLKEGNRLTGSCNLL